MERRPDMANCTYNGTEYGPGSEVCMEGFIKVCNPDGQWDATGTTCDEEGKVIKKVDADTQSPS